MIQIFVSKKNNIITQIKCWGHANIGSYNDPLVCAAITGILTGGANAIEELESKNYDIYLKKGNAKITSLNNKNNFILKIIYYQLLTLKEQYENIIKWKEEN